MDLLFIVDGGRENAIEMRAGACLNGLSGGIATQSGLHRGCCLTRTGPKYVGT